METSVSLKHFVTDSGLWTLKLTMYLKNEQTELTDFLHAGSNSCKLRGA